MHYLSPLFEHDGENEKRQWSLKVIIERLKSIRKQRATIGDIPIGDIITTPDEEQSTILELLKVKL